MQNEKSLSNDVCRHTMCAYVCVFVRVRTLAQKDALAASFEAAEEINLETKML